MKKGTDLNKIFYITRTKAGCPRIRIQKVGLKGVTAIECTNVGNTFGEHRHLKRVRVKYTNKNNEEKEIFINDVYTEVSQHLINRYSHEGDKFLWDIGRKIEWLEKIQNKHDTYITNTQEKLYRWNKRCGL